MMEKLTRVLKLPKCYANMPGKETPVCFCSVSIDGPCLDLLLRTLVGIFGAMENSRKTFFAQIYGSLKHAGIWTGLLSLLYHHPTL